MTSSIEEIDCIEELRRKMDESEDFEFRRVVRAKIRKLKKEQETSDEGRNVTTVYPHSYLKQQNNNKNNNNNNNNNKNINKNNGIKTSEKKNNTNDKNNNNTSNNNCNKTTTTKTNKLIAGNLCNADKRKSDFKSTETNVVEGASKKNECSRNQIDSSEVEATDIAGENKSDTKTNAGDTNNTTNNNERKDDGTNNNKDNNKNKDNNNNKDKNVNKDNNSITTTTTTSSNSDGSKRYDISNKNNVTNKTIATNNPNIDNNKDNDNISNIKTSLKKTSNTNNNIKTNNNNINNNIKTNNNNNNNTDNKPEFGKVVLKKLNKETSTPDTPSNKRTQNLTARQALKMFKSMDKENNGSKVRGGAGFCGNTAPKEATIRDKMLTWCRNRLGGYEHINIKDFSSSWNDGMAFCALANSYFPHLFDYDLLKPSDKRHNFTLAFSTFRDEADIPQLLEVDDMLVTSYPDWKCIFTYVNSVVARMQELKKEREIDGVVD